MLSHNLVYHTHIQKASEPPSLRPRFAFLLTIDDRLHFILRAINMKPMKLNTWTYVLSYIFMQTYRNYAQLKRLISISLWLELGQCWAAKLCGSSLFIYYCRSFIPLSPCISYKYQYTYFKISWFLFWFNKNRYWKVSEYVPILKAILTFPYNVALFIL